MRLDEFRNTDPQGLLNIIRNDIVDAERIDCHGTVAKAIRDGVLGDNDYVVVVGPKGGKHGFHSIGLSQSGDIKVDTFSKYMTEYNPNGGTITYHKDKKDIIMTQMAHSRVADLK